MKVRLAKIGDLIEVFKRRRGGGTRGAPRTARLARKENIEKSCAKFSESSREEEKFGRICSHYSHDNELRVTT